MKTPSWRTTSRVTAILIWIASLFWLIESPGFEPLIGFLSGLGPLLLSFKASDEPITAFPVVALTPEQQQRNRANMLQLVWNTWIEGVLKKSLYDEILIELGMQTRPDAVEHPWDMVVRMPQQEPSLVARGTTMLELFERSGGSLLILGEPGAGKTTMLLELARQAILRAQADPTQPVPVVFNLSSWTPGGTLSEWLVNELRDKYYVSARIGHPWVEDDELLLLLDGLDELKAEHRDACVRAINAFRDEHSSPLAICSRRQEHEALEARLRMSAAVLIQPLTERQIDEYLSAAGTGLAAVGKALKLDPELREFAQSPLILSVLVLAYRDAPQEELQALEMAGDCRQRLFDAYIGQMFKRRLADRRYTPRRVKRWLAWIAHSMIERGQSLFYIEDIKPDRLAWSRMKFRLLFGLLYGLMVAPLVGLIFGLLFGLPFGLRFGLVFGLSVGLLGGLGAGPLGVNAKPTERLSWSGRDAWKRLSVRLLSGLVFGLAVGLIIGLMIGPSVGMSVGLLVGLIFGLIFGLVFGLLGGLSVGLSGSATESRSIPGEGIRASLKNYLTVGLLFDLVVGLIFGLIFGLSAWLRFGPVAGLRFGLVVVMIFGLSIGLLFGLFFGLWYGGYFLIAHLLSRYLLCRSGHIPWSLIAFLDYCTDRIFLRPVGGGYIFIHRMLMEHFAASHHPDVPVADP